MGMLSSKETPVIWRGPMASRLVQQFFLRSRLGRARLSAGGSPAGNGGRSAHDCPDGRARGSRDRYDTAGGRPDDRRKGTPDVPARCAFPCSGVIENMSSFACPHCGERTEHLLDRRRRGSGRRTWGCPSWVASRLIRGWWSPVTKERPRSSRDPGSPAAGAYREIARRVALEVARSNQAERGGVAESITARKPTPLVVRWHDGSEDRFGFEYLRNHCPCATCVDEWSGKRRSLTLLLTDQFRAPGKLVPVGNYGVQIHWNDGHETGIYSHHLLRRLARQQEEAPAPGGLNCLTPECGSSHRHRGRRPPNSHVGLPYGANRHPV